MWYTVDIDKLYEWGDYRFNDNCKEYPNITMEEYNAEPYRLILVDGELVPNPNYEKEKKEKEKERISHLRCTKRVLALILQKLGTPYSQLKALIDSNPQAQLEWELCVELERSNPLLDIMGAQLGITPEQLDIMFKYANGEVDKLN